MESICPILTTLGRSPLWFSLIHLTSNIAHTVSKEMPEEPLLTNQPVRVSSVRKRQSGSSQEDLEVHLDFHLNPQGGQ